MESNKRSYHNPPFISSLKKSLDHECSLAGQKSFIFQHQTQQDKEVYASLELSAMLWDDLSQTNVAIFQQSAYVTPNR